MRVTKGDDRETLVAFIDRYVISFEAWDTLVYFAAHPDHAVTVNDLSRDIGRRPADLEKAAGELAQRGAVDDAGLSDRAWRLCCEPDFRHGLALFADAITDQKERLFVLTRLLENLSR